MYIDACICIYNCRSIYTEKFSVYKSVNSTSEATLAHGQFEGLDKINAGHVVRVWLDIGKCLNYNKISKMMTFVKKLTLFLSFLYNAFNKAIFYLWACHIFFNNYPKLHLAINK